MHSARYRPPTKVPLKRVFDCKAAIQRCGAAMWSLLVSRLVIHWNVLDVGDEDILWFNKGSAVQEDLITYSVRASRF